MITWLNVHLWGPMWPNVFAPSVFTLLGIAASHIRSARQRRKQHEELKQHVTDTLGGARD